MKHFDIMTLGVPILEVTRMELDKPFSQAGLFYGPVPAGDPGIAMNACVRLGYTGAYVGVTGEDAFADCFFAQMAASGIDVTYLRRDPAHDTALSMLTQFSDGSRDFVFTVPHSAAATLCEDDVCVELLRNVTWIHLSGFAMSISESSAQAHKKLVELAPQETRISFDPNFRPQVIDRETYLRHAMPLLERCDCFLPSRGEAALFAQAGESEEAFCRRLSHSKAVALKDGSNGSYVFQDGDQRHLPGYRVEEVDSTGAGDTYDGAFIAALMDGKDVWSAGEYATAAGAVAVTRRGLMDIAPTREDIADRVRRGR